MDLSERSVLCELGQPDRGEPAPAPLLRRTVAELLREAFAGRKLESAGGCDCAGDGILRNASEWDYARVRGGYWLPGGIL